MDYSTQASLARFSIVLKYTCDVSHCGFGQVFSDPRIQCRNHVSQNAVFPIADGGGKQALAEADRPLDSLIDLGEGDGVGRSAEAKAPGWATYGFDQLSPAQSLEYLGQVRLRGMEGLGNCGGADSCGCLAASSTVVCSASEAASDMRSTFAMVSSRSQIFGYNYT
jgi:hypothetical protein